MSPKSFLPALGLLGILASPGFAQSDPAPGYLWVFPQVEFYACVDFLMAPDLATRQLPQGFQVIPAASFAPLSPLLHREVEGDTAYGGWIPAQVCFIESPTVDIGGSVFSPDKKMGARELIGYWAIAASRTGGAPALDQWYVAQYWTNDWRVRKRSESAFIPMTVFKRNLVKVPESTNQNYSVTIGKTVLSWKGQMSGRDSTAVGESRATTQIFDGKRSIRWAGVASLAPRWMRHLPGVFNIQGKDDLAKALKASPIRMFGPMYWGGDARVEFTRQSASGAPPSGG